MHQRTYKGLALLLLAISQFVLALDYTIIFVALPSLAADLGFSANHLQWVISAFSLAYGGFLLIGGRLSDLLGRRRMFIIAMSLFGLGSLLGGFAESQLLLIIARGVQGLGGALLSPATLSLIMSNFEEGQERNRALGVWASMGGVGLSVGLLLGGILTSYIGWEATFFVNVPVALLVVILSPIALNESKTPAQTRHYDIAGTVSVTLGMILIVYYLIQSPVAGWLTMKTIIPGLIGVVSLLFFIKIEQRTQEPLIPFRLFRIRSLTGAALLAALFSASFGTLYYFLTMYTQDVLHYSAIQSGLSFLPLTLSAFFGAKLINKMVKAVGIAGTIAVGMGLGVIGFMLLTQLSASGSAWGILPGIVIIGIGQAFVFTTMYIAASSGIQPNEQGVASAIVSTGQQLGGAIGLAVIMAIISSSMGTNGTMESMTAADLNVAIHMAFFLDAGIACLGILVAFLALRHKSSIA
ncbi:arabinose ABC transporter permease [Paenibacillus ferrarius]|uniref:Arabinose ABC transporter permease n=1 Tax=Paenibacillus ferrarius TaxID=1469647 RepID=A0A1V4HJ67_9BACL|nr:MFS transporter [Paenibacillus ferrarius]OPH57173.1 arabinose ABC transporter permease [Paenibacillus ferrarius]